MEDADFGGIRSSWYPGQLVYNSDRVLNLVQGDGTMIPVVEEIEHTRRSASSLDLASAKQLSKRREKERVGKKFVVGETLYLDTKKKTYILKKFIYTLHTDVVNVLIVKPLSFTPGESIDTLTRADCRKYHIKYEPNLFVMPMDMRWHKLSTNGSIRKTAPSR